MHEIEGRFRVLAHSTAANAFVLGGLFETGVLVLMEVLIRIDDRDGHLIQSHYRLPLHAVSAVVAEDGAQIALLARPGWASDEPISLWLYRVAGDELFGPLGPAPGPPPSDYECDRAYPSIWLDLERQDSYEDLDPNIVTFSSASELRASYGRDTCRARAKQRRTRSWQLSQLGAAWVPPASEQQELP